MNFRKTSSSWLGYTNLWLTYRCQSSMNQEKPRLCFHYLGQQAIQSVHFWTILWFLQTTWMWSLWSWWHGESQNLKFSPQTRPKLVDQKCKMFAAQESLWNATASQWQNKTPKKNPQKIHLEPTKNHCVFLLKKHHLPTNRHHFLGFNHGVCFRSNDSLASPSIERQAKARTCQMTWRKMRSAWKHLRGGSKNNTWFLRKMQTKKYFDSYFDGNFLCLFWFPRKKNKKRYL